MATCKLYKFVQRTIMNDRVRIQDEDVFAAARANAGIIAPGKTKILLVLNNSYFRIVLSNELDGAVDRAVIRHDDLEVFRVSALVNRAQAIANHAEVVPANNYDGEFHRFRFHRGRRSYTLTTFPFCLRDSSAASSMRTMRNPASPSLKGRLLFRMQSMKYDASTFRASICSILGDHMSPVR